MSKECANLDSIPLEILECICSNLEFIDILQMSEVNRRLFTCCLSRSILKKSPVVIGMGGIQSSTFRSRLSITLSKKMLSRKRYVFAACEALTTKGYHDLNQEILVDLVAFFPALTSVDLSLNGGIDDASIRLICSNCPLISHLDLSRCRIPTHKAMHHIASLEKLRSLNISFTRIATNKSLMHLNACGSTSLTKLGLSKCHLVEWDVMPDILCLYTLSYLDLSGNWSINPDFLNSFALNLLNELKMDVKDCEQLTVQDVQNAIQISGGRLAIQHNCQLKDHSEASIHSHSIVHPYTRQRLGSFISTRQHEPSMTSRTFKNKTLKSPFVSIPDRMEIQVPSKRNQQPLPASKTRDVYARAAEPMNANAIQLNSSSQPTIPMNANMKPMAHLYIPKVQVKPLSESQGGLVKSEEEKQKPEKDRQTYEPKFTVQPFRKQKAQLIEFASILVERLFHCHPVWLSVPLTDYIHTILTRTRLPPTTLVTAFLYLVRLKKRHPRCKGSDGSGHRLMLAAIVLAAKYLHDDTFDNTSWATVSSGLFGLVQVNQMETELLYFLDYHLYVSANDWKEFCDEVQLELSFIPEKVKPVFLNQSVSTDCVDLAFTLERTPAVPLRRTLSGPTYVNFVDGFGMDQETVAYIQNL